MWGSGWSSFIRTVTVGPGFAPGLPRWLNAARGLAYTAYRRSGIAPCPEDLFNLRANYTDLPQLLSSEHEDRSFASSENLQSQRDGGKISVIPNRLTPRVRQGYEPNNQSSNALNRNLIDAVYNLWRRDPAPPSRTGGCSIGGYLRRQSSCEIEPQGSQQANSGTRACQNLAVAPPSPDRYPYARRN